MRAIACASISMVCLLACASTPTHIPHPFTGALPEDTSVDLSGTFTFSLIGELVLALETPCTLSQASPQGPVVRTYCDRAHLEAVQVVAEMPWQHEITGIWIDANHIAFRVDWKTCGLDPLADDAAALITHPWTISGTQWTPTFAQSERILKLVETVTETETDLIRGGEAPSLEITSFEIKSIEGTNGVFHAGGEDEIVVKIANRGLGTAYRVTATTRSSIRSLHDKQLSFGMIQPGGEKLRRLRVAVPAAETAPSTMLVLVLSEGNRFTPRNLSRRISITASKASPLLAAHCSISGNTGVHPAIDAGDRVTLHCTVGNTGTIGAQVELETSVAGGPPVLSAAQEVAPGGRASFDIPIGVPRNLPIDSSIEIAVTAHDRRTPRIARAAVIGKVGKPRVCSIGDLSRKEYQAKIAALRAEQVAGIITQSQLDHFDAELVACLK
jgi:hypothetical protein